ncbi:helix-turn-helix domain-containing protein [Microbacterium sp. HD4P20]|uniref:IclR family transcriptional regulator domain-containing protein n=1 Tax=Microbacterium sp. HD4P20 TaxID=2864874 RepID=UPI001C63E231|nr:IclR family transcriptional regulator C-terminal domain-containing protein [Microbacterium sp. HD4P20]MCP2635640.1 helix-turn-helix domain-containing protein [Microbacterium sp. HD4P20]
MTAERTDRSRDRVQSIERGVAVLRVFDGRPPLLSAGEIAARSALPRPVVRRILLTFEHLGYVRGDRGLWSLTPRILELGAAYFSDSSLPVIARPAMEDVVQQLREACSLGALSGADVIHVARVEDHRPLPGSVRVGESLPASATAIGKVLLAALDDSSFDAVLPLVDWEPHTPHTLTDADALRERIALVRARGYDVSIEELNPGMVAAAVPIMAGGVAVGALGVSSTTVRQDEASLTRDAVPALKAAAERVARGYLGANPHLHRASAADPAG